MRVGDTVRRNAGPWTPAVHSLLRHLEYVGFGGSPRAFGIDEQGREVLSFIEGDCGSYPLGPQWVTDAALAAVATTLRMFHDAQYGFVPPPGSVWRAFGPPPPDSEVICHHDAAPHNMIWRPDGTLALIDFDLASPGSRGSTTWRTRPGPGCRSSPTGTPTRSAGAGSDRRTAVAPFRRLVRADPGGPLPLGGDHPQADRRSRRGHPPDGGQLVTRRSCRSSARAICAGRSGTCRSSTWSGKSWRWRCARPR